MSKNSVLSYFSAPFWGEKRCKIIANFNTDQIFSKLFFNEVINRLSKIGNKFLILSRLNQKKFFQKKLIFFLFSRQKR